MDALRRSVETEKVGGSPGQTNRAKERGERAGAAAGEGGAEGGLSRSMIRAAGFRSGSLDRQRLADAQIRTA